MRPFLVTLAVCAAVSLVAGHLVAWSFNMARPPLVPALFILSMTLMGGAAALALMGYIAWLAFGEREPDPIPRVLTKVRGYTSADYLATRVAPLAITFLFISTFNTLKILIPRINPFFLDGFLSDLDRFLFGTDAWRLTHSVIGSSGTRMIDFVYLLWFPVWVLAVIHFSFFASKELQRRFFLSFFAIWAILGIAMALLMSSAGPCFLELINHPYATRYAGLFPLQDAPIAAKAQEALADAYLTGEISVAKGISAMPSVHVAVMALIVLAVRTYSRWIFAAALFLYMMIFVGSVHLGWHYVSDGVVGTAGAILFWRMTRPVAQRCERLTCEAELQRM